MVCCLTTLGTNVCIYTIIYNFVWNLKQKWKVHMRKRNRGSTKLVSVSAGWKPWALSQWHTLCPPWWYVRHVLCHWYWGSARPFDEHGQSLSLYLTWLTPYITHFNAGNNGFLLLLLNWAIERLSVFLLYSSLSTYYNWLYEDVYLSLF